MQNIMVILQDLVKRLKEQSLLSVIDKIWLFGSRVRDEADERSDIDLAILCPNATLTQWYKIVDIIEETPTLLKFDIIRYEEASGEFQQRIQQEGRVVYE